MRASPLRSAQDADAAARACCFAIAKRLIGQGEMLVDKQPGMAYALAGLALHIGEKEPILWQTLDAQLKVGARER